jgi:hypothetical protein
MNKIFIDYNNLYKFYQIELLNLKILEEKKEKIRLKYFSVTSSLTDNVAQKTENVYNKYDNYLIDLEKEHILEQIQEKHNYINRLNYYLKKIEFNLSELRGIEYRLFYKVINGVNISKAVTEVASENCSNNKKPQEESIIWKKYYPNVKKEINNFKKIQEEVSNLYEQ